MATAPQALLVALDLMRVPALAPALRRQAFLPDGILEVIRIAGGCRRTCREAARATGKSPEMIKEAAVFYLQQALLFPEADSYRVLGVAPDAPQEKLREHMLWLMRGLHPDRNANNWEAVFAGRVLEAWGDLKSPSRRAHYDRLRRRTVTAPPPASLRLRRRTRRSRAAALPLVAMPLEASQPRQRRPRLVTWALALFVGLVTWLTPWPNIEIGSQRPASSEADNELAEAHKPAVQPGMIAVQE